MTGTKAYHEGYNAYFRCSEDNPYEFDSKNAGDYFNGWQDAWVDDCAEDN